MIDRILYAMFGWIDEVCFKVQLGIENLYGDKKKNVRKDKKKLNNYIESLHKKHKEMNLVKYLKKEVEIGGNGTQKYVVKNGINKGKIL